MSSSKKYSKEKLTLFYVVGPIAFIVSFVFGFVSILSSVGGSGLAGALVLIGSSLLIPIVVIDRFVVIWLGVLWTNLIELLLLLIGLLYVMIF